MDPSSRAGSSLVLNDAAAEPAARELADTVQVVRPAVRNQRTPSPPVGLPLAKVPSLDRILPIITIAWLAGVVLLLARMAGGWWRVRKLHQIALATNSSRWQTACRRLAYRLGLP